MQAARLLASSYSQGVSSTENSETLYTLVDGLTEDVADGVTLFTFPSLSALLELEEMFVAEFGRRLQAGEIKEVVMLRPKDKLRSS